MAGETGKLDQHDAAADTAEVRHQHKEVFCGDFDLGCFVIENPAGCKTGTSVVINEILYKTLPVKSICPLCDRLRD